MKRHLRDPRENWQSKVEQRGMIYHTANNRPYWDESVCYEFTLAEVERIEAATEELWTMVLAAVQYVIDRNRFAELRIPADATTAIIASWDEAHASLHGRFDLAYDGAHLGLLEFNADTPTALIEAAVIQWDWLQEVYPSGDQFNAIHDKLIAKWKDMRLNMIDTPVLHFAHTADTEDMMTVSYLRDTAEQAGFITEALTMTEIGWADGRFVDLNGHPIKAIYKLYPWEWMLNEEFGEHAVRHYGRMRWIEPIWKMLAANKGLLAILWELYPKHPLLLETYLDQPFDPSRTKPDGPYMIDYVRKPLYSREGSNVTIYRHNVPIVETAGDYGNGGFICQAVASLPAYRDESDPSRRLYPVIGSWYVIDQGACGIGIRESDGPVTTNMSRFIPHFIRTEAINGM